MSSFATKRIAIDITGIGSRLKKARKLDDRPLTMLAAIAGMTTSNWHRIESERFDTIPIATIEKIEKTLGITLIIEEENNAT